MLALKRVAEEESGVHYAWQRPHNEARLMVSHTVETRGRQGLAFMGRVEQKGSLNGKEEKTIVASTFGCQTRL